MKKIKKYINIGILIMAIIGVISSIVSFVYFLDDLDIVDLGDFTIIENDNSETISISSEITDQEIRDVLTMSDTEVWQGLTGGLLSARPDDIMPSNASQITQNVESQLETITIPTWAWEDENDTTNLNKVTKNRSIQVNKLLSKLWTDFFTDLYNADPNFVIAEGFYGCYRVDGTENGQIGYKSAHTYGAAIDLNWYDAGNPYGDEQPYTKEEWEKLPENHLKYQIIYKDSPIVQIAHKYTLLWGGEWSGTTKDIMHFSFVCDGKTRAERIQLFAN